MKNKVNWTQVELQRIFGSDDLKISPFRADGKTYGTPTWIWSVTTGGGLYVRAYNGIKSRWYQSAIEQKAGLIQVAGMKRKVLFTPVTENEINDMIDVAYKIKYNSSSYLAAMIGIEAKATTLKVEPLEKSDCHQQVNL